MLEGLTHIGVDELSYRKHHEYITVVYDHVNSRVVWTHPGKSAETLKHFFAELGPERTSKIKAVSIDMSAAYTKAVRQAVPQATLIYDRFHVQRLAHDALDEVRRDEVRSGVPGALKRTRWALQKNPWNLTLKEQEKLTSLEQKNKRLYRAYLLKESLIGIMDGRQWRVAEGRLHEWMQWAQRSRLKPFVKVANTVASHMEGILNYIRTGLTNGAVEGINGKIRTITRRAFGFHDVANLMALVHLCCSGIRLFPVVTYP